MLLAPLGRRLLDSNPMPFVRQGKKADKKRDREAKVEAREAMIDRALGAARVAINSPRLCLPMCVLVERILTQVLPAPHFSLRLGSLQVEPEDKNIDPIYFDPRSPDGIDGGFHAWLEDTNGQLLDPSILITLHADGYKVDPSSYLLVGGRTSVLPGLRFVYEELPELELLGMAASEPHLAVLMAWAMHGKIPPAPGRIYLDVGWRNSVTPGWISTVDTSRSLDDCSVARLETLGQCRVDIHGGHLTQP